MRNRTAIDWIIAGAAYIPVLLFLLIISDYIPTPSILCNQFSGTVFVVISAALFYAFACIAGPERDSSNYPCVCRSFVYPILTVLMMMVYGGILAGGC